MYRQLIRKWISLLKSGKFTPTKGKLRKSDVELCPLGLLCEAYSPSYWEYDIERDEYKYMGESEHLPEKIRSLIPNLAEIEEKIIISNDLGIANYQEIASFVRRKLL